jgi:predicted secreted protein
MVLTLLLSALWLHGGDTAVFVDLGFSADGRTYMFGQYGVDPGTLRPWAELAAVDVASNSFVPGGRVGYIHDSAVAAGHDGAGALYRVIARNTALADRCRIGYLLQGHPLYVSMENHVSAGGETIEFRDFEKAASFRAVLRDSASPEGSSFVISLERRAVDGSTRTYTAGSASIRRPGIIAYRIRRVLAAPNGSLVFVIEMKKQNSDGSVDIRYMVETLKL